VADTMQNFSGETTGPWEYLVSPPNENEFEEMNFDDRRYGECWYDEDYIRICQASGHPGNGVDVAWRWTSDFAGRVSVLLTAHKIDRGGDGVIIRAYHNGTAVQGLELGGSDTAGVSGQPFFEADVQPGDTLTFVMNKNGSAVSDHTAFMAQIFRR
jgi:hypothetical protein